MQQYEYYACMCLKSNDSCKSLFMSMNYLSLKNHVAQQLHVDEKLNIVKVLITILYNK